MKYQQEVLFVCLFLMKSDPFHSFMKQISRSSVSPDDPRFRPGLCGACLHCLVFLFEFSRVVKHDVWHPYLVGSESYGHHAVVVVWVPHQVLVSPALQERGTELHRTCGLTRLSLVFTPGR